MSFSKRLPLQKQRKMKRFTLTTLFLGLSIFLFSQTMEDKQSVIQRSIDLDELQQYYKLEEVDGNKALIIFA